MVTQYAFFFNASLCSGCKACQVACKDKNNLKAGILWRRVYEVSGGGWQKKGAVWEPHVLAYNISMACNHCQEPICSTSCPTKAIFKREDGIVLIDTPRCIGCRYCEWACPYGAPRYDPARGIVTKCDFCLDSIDQGGAPACVTACPMRALDFGELDDLRKKYGGTDQVFPLPDPSQVKPALVIKPHRDEARVQSLGAEVVNWEEI